MINKIIIALMFVVYIITTMFYYLKVPPKTTKETPIPALVQISDPTPEEPSIRWGALYISIKGVKEDLILNYNLETESKIINKFKEDFKSNKEILELEVEKDGWIIVRTKDILYIATDYED